MTLVKKKNPKAYNGDDRVQHQRWCLRNEIRVYIEPINRMYGNIVTEIKTIKYYDNDTQYKLDNKPIRKKRKKGDPPHLSYSDAIMKTYTNLYIKYYE